MGSIDVRNEKEKTELKFMVESLQISLFNHKQHIASEVRESLLSELSQLVLVSHKNITDNNTRTLANLECAVKLELQALSFRVEAVENKIIELYGRVNSIEEDNKKKFSEFDKGFFDISEQRALLQQKFFCLSESTKKIEDQLEKNTKNLMILKENLSFAEMNVLQEMKVKFSDLRRELDGIRYESEARTQGEFHKIQEKMQEFSFSIESRGFVKEKNRGSPLIKESNKETKEIIKYIDAAINKNSMDFGNLRRRVENLEISENICAEFRKSKGHS